MRERESTEMRDTRASLEASHELKKRPRGAGKTGESARMYLGEPLAIVVIHALIRASWVQSPVRHRLLRACRAKDRKGCDE